LQEKRTTSIRRTAQIPLKESIAAEAPCGFETEADCNEAVDTDDNHRMIHQFHGTVGTVAIISAYPSFEQFS